MITLDNASNNDTMMRELERLLKALNIPFERDGNRIRSVSIQPVIYCTLFTMIPCRCFPHVINIAVKAGIKLLTKAPPKEPSAAVQDSSNDSDYDEDDNDDDDSAIRSATSNPALQDNPEYAAALRRDPVTMARKLVKTLRSSFARRQGLRETIAEGNRAGRFTDQKKIAHAELLRDVDTRWSSMYFMINRFIEMYEGIYHYLDQPGQRAIRSQALGNVELRVLLDIRQFLSVFYAVQMMNSHEKTPTLSTTIPTYELILSLLRSNRSLLRPLAHAVNESIARIEKYLNRARSNPVYAMSMGKYPHYLIYLSVHDAEHLTLFQSYTRISNYRGSRNTGAKQPRMTLVDV